MLRIILILVVCIQSVSTVWSQEVIDTVCMETANTLYAVEYHQGSSYTWSVAGGTIISGNGSNSINVTWGKQPGLFRMSVVEQNQMHCPGDSVISYVLIRGPEFKVDYPPVVCRYDSVTITASGGIWYNWNTGQTDSIIKIKLIQDTLLSVKISDTACDLREETMQVMIKAAEKPSAGYNSTVDEYFKGEVFNLNYTGNDQDKVTWNIDKANIRNRNGLNVNVVFNDTGEAYIKLFSTNKLGCKDSMDRVVNIKDEQLFFPTAFTPNGDGLNDVFKPGGIGIKSYHLEVYNRWGELVFESDNMHEGWDGTFNGAQVQAETYAYQCESRGNSGKLHPYVGSVTIIR